MLDTNIISELRDPHCHPAVQAWSEILSSYNARITLIVLGLIDVKWRVILEPDPETNDWSVWCPELPGCVSCGETQAEALENFRRRSHCTLSHL